MKSKLEHIIEKAHTLQSNVQEPLPGHEERFDMRLMRKSQSSSKGKVISNWWIGVAAAIAIGVIVVIATREVRQADDLMALNKVEAIEEVMVMDSLYKAKVGARMPVIPEQDMYTARILKEVQRLETEYKKMEQNLATGADPERITNEMVKNYQFRIRLIEQLRQYLMIKEQNKKANEKVS
jgi:hypothetical protein